VPTYGCPLDMRVELLLPHMVFAPPFFAPELKVCFLDDRSFTSATWIVHRKAALQASSPHPISVEPAHGETSQEVSVQVMMMKGPVLVHEESGTILM
jgi:hypothetical protein